MSNRSSRRAPAASAATGFRHAEPARGNKIPPVGAASAGAAAANSSCANVSPCVHIRQAIQAPAPRAARGQGLEIAYGFHDSPFGLALLLVSEGRNAEGLCGLAFAGHQAEKMALLTGMCSRWPKAACREALQVTTPYASQVFSQEFPATIQRVDIVLYGTEFELSVWRALLTIPLGMSASYSDIAKAVGSPLAVRAVGAAISRNPLAYVAPCHRVLRKDGGLGGYRWGASRKQAMVKWEQNQLERLQAAVGLPPT
jgi:AraC family transcriptional regulator, regulatory protein of adaptative response / methylated-DNA-[protein]-cysteine methyltransferase